MAKAQQQDEAAWEPVAVARAVAHADLPLDPDQQARLARALGQEWAGLRAMLDVTSTALRVAEGTLRSLAAGLPGVDPAPTLRYLARVMDGAAMPAVLVRLKAAEDLGRVLLRLVDGDGPRLSLSAVRDPSAVVSVVRVTLADQHKVEAALGRWAQAKAATQQDPTFGGGAVAHG